MKKTFCLLLVCFWPVAAQAATWKQLGPSGGEIGTIVSNPQNRSELWAVSGSNPTLIFRSTDGGANWKRIAVAKEIFYGFTFHPASGIFYALGKEAFYKSSDHGVHWAPGSLAKNFYGEGGEIALHPSNSKLMYAAGYYQQTDSRRSMAFLKSADGGKTWSVQTFEPSSLNGILYRLAVNPSSPNIILAAGYFIDAGGQTRYRIYKSSDGGATWANITGSFSSLIRDIAPHPSDPKMFYVATDYAVWRTSDGGASWVKNNGAACGYCLTLDPANPEILYAGYSRVIYRSLNGGVDWEASTEGLYGDINGVEILPAKILCGSSAGVFACAAESGLSGWGAWTPSSNGLKAAIIRSIAIAPSSPSIVYAAHYFYGILKSRDSGSTWKLLKNPWYGSAACRLAVHPANPDVVYALTNLWGPDSIYGSKDGGQTWKEILIADARDLALSQKNPGRIFIAGQTADGSNSVMGLYFSRDGGAHWAHYKVSSAAGSCGYAVAVDPKNDNVVYLGGQKSSGIGGIYKSTNQGKGWKDITGDLTSTVNDIAIDPKNTRRVYAATYSGIWKSENGGVTWTNVRSGSFGCLFIHPTAANIINTAGYYEVLVSKNYGATWAAFDQGLILKGSVAEFAFNKSTKTLFAATYGSSIWKRKF